MIQRIQSIYLLLASGSFGGSLLAPFASSLVAVPGTVLADQHFDSTDSVGMLALFSVAALASFAAVFLYKNRKLQSKVSWACVIGGISGIIFGIYAFMQDGDAMGNVAIDEQLGAVLPMVGTVFSFLAIRNIGRDERLVRSADRLR